MFLRSIVLLAAALVSIHTAASADTLRIASWNVKAGSAENLLLRREGLKAAGKRLRPDILILQEINSFASLQVIKNAMGIEDAEIAISNFGSDAEKVFFGFELAVISKVPIVKVEEWQVVRRERGKEFPDPNGPIRISRTGAITTATTDDKHVLVVPSDVITDREARKARVPRGVLRVELANGLVIYPVHLKSNGVGLCRVVGEDIGDAFRALNKIGEAVPSVQDQTEATIQSIRKFTRGRGNKDNLNSWAVQKRFPAFTEGHVVTAQQR